MIVKVYFPRHLLMNRQYPIHIHNATVKIRYSMLYSIGDTHLYLY